MQRIFKTGRYVRQLVLARSPAHPVRAACVQVRTLHSENVPSNVDVAAGSGTSAATYLRPIFASCESCGQCCTAFSQLSLENQRTAAIYSACSSQCIKGCVKTFAELTLSNLCIAQHMNRHKRFPPLSSQ
jgi:hypothetical protein